MKSYFKPLLSYLMNHPSVLSLPLAIKEQQILSFVEENKSSINLFLYPCFKEEVEDFKSCVREFTNENLLPVLEPSFISTILSLFPVFYRENTQPLTSEISQVFQSLLQYERSREELFIAFSFWESGEPSSLINGLFVRGDSYTVKLIESESEIPYPYTAKMILDFTKAILFLSPLLSWQEEETGITFSSEDIYYLSSKIKKRFSFLPLDLIKKAIDLNFPLKENSNSSHLSKLGAILKEKSRFPMLKDKLKGSLTSGESWFAIEFNNPNLDKRILKELWESYKEWLL